MMNNTPWQFWRSHFESNRSRPLPVFESSSRGQESPPPSLLRSLAVFQRGEAGEGRIARDIERCHLRGVDDDYRAALKLFVAEEGRHARILGDMLRALGGETLTVTWTDRLFVWGRRLMGIRLKLMVLLPAEVIGGLFYRAIADALPSECARQLRAIADDEAHHWAFHVEFFRRHARSSLGRVMYAALWSGIASAALLTVLVDHRQTLRVLGRRQMMIFAAMEAIARTFVAMAQKQVTSTNPLVLREA